METTNFIWHKNQWSGFDVKKNIDYKPFLKNVTILYPLETPESRRLN